MVHEYARAPTLDQRQVRMHILNRSASRGRAIMPACALALAAIMAAIASGCAATGPTAGHPVAARASAATSPTPTADPHSLSVPQECQRQHGAKAKARDQDGAGSTGWYCFNPKTGELIEFTEDDMQQACDHQKPGTIAVHQGDTPAPGGNSLWRCLRASEMPVTPEPPLPKDQPSTH